MMSKLYLGYQRIGTEMCILNVKVACSAKNQVRILAKFAIHGALYMEHLEIFLIFYNGLQLYKNIGKKFNLSAQWYI